MCGRSSLSKVEKELEERFNASFYSDALAQYNPLPNYNVAPTHMHPVITNDDQEHLQFFRWGLIPFWAKDSKIGYKMINARVETVMEKKAFSKSLQSQRCIVPFDGFYEWKKVPGGKQPFRITLKDEGIFSVAGLWEKWKSPEGETIFSFTLITQPPNKLLADIHDRMPAILLPEHEQLWLDNEISGEEALKIIKPYPEELLRAYMVSKRVGKVAENDAALLDEVKIEEIIPKEGKQGSLF